MLRVKFFGVLKRRVRATRSGKILYTHYRKIHLGHHKGRKYRNVSKNVPSSHKGIFRSYM